MANINISWTDNPADVSDIDSYEVYVCDATPTGHFGTAAALQTKLDAIHAATDKAAETAAQGLVLVESITDLTAKTISSPYAAPGTGTYHFGVAAKNQGGFKVQDDTSVDSVVVS